ncbi:hypothetical protein ACH4ZX_35795 [Streptomyces sp. NPDC020490]|uniref:hypothetical protein n=1 Tax=Streptomyces sp. NPDC020490 TaxID=3365078 RepID=UPI003791FD23
MRRVGAVLAAVLAALALAGCGGGASGRAVASGASRAAADGHGGGVAAADERTPTTRAVRADIRAAAVAGGFGQPEFLDVRRELNRWGPCQVFGRILTSAPPARAAAARAVAVLEDRGWKANGPIEDEAGVGWVLLRKGWSISALFGVASAETIAAGLPPGQRDRAKDFKGVIFEGTGRGCTGSQDSAASPSP